MMGVNIAFGIVSFIYAAVAIYCLYMIYILARKLGKK
jgi:hypothetical protein